MISRARAERGVPAGARSAQSAASRRNTGCFGATASEHLVGAVGVDAVEELADLELPATEVGAEHVDLVGVGELVGDVVGAVPAEQQVEPAVVGAHVAHPLAVPTRGDEVVDAVER